MSRKKSQPDEFAAMAKVYEVLKPFGIEARHRMLVAVEEKIHADQAAGEAQSHQAAEPICVDAAPVKGIA